VLSTGEAASESELSGAVASLDVEELYSRAMAAHGVDDGRDEFRAKVQAARKRVVDQMSEQRALQEKNGEPSA